MAWQLLLRRSNAKMKQLKGLHYYTVLLSVALGLAGCAVTQSSASKRTSFSKDGESVSKGQVTQAELQDDLLRFESQFNARIESASQHLEASTNPKIRFRAALNRLIYASNSLNIALGPSPESNLLDMVTFMELSREVLIKHWISDLFGSGGKPLEQAFTDSSRQIWAIAGKVLDPQQRSVLQDVISAWRNKHPDQINVETVRLSTFSTEAGAKAAGLDQSVGGLFASLEQSTQAVDSARLFSERALYYAERAPFLFKLQARLGAIEIMDDVGLNLARLPSPLAHEPSIRALLQEVRETLLVTRTTLADANATTRSVNELMGRLSGNPQSARLATAALTRLTDLLKEWNRLLSSASYKNGVSQAASLANVLDQRSNRFLMKLAWLGFSLIAFFWMMFVLSNLAYQYFLVKGFGPVKSQSRDEHRNKAA